MVVQTLSGAHKLLARRWNAANLRAALLCFSIQSVVWPSAALIYRITCMWSFRPGRSFAVCAWEIRRRVQINRLIWDSPASRYTYLRCRRLFACNANERAIVLVITPVFPSGLIWGWSWCGGQRTQFGFRPLCYYAPALSRLYCCGTRAMNFAATLMCRNECGHWFEILSER